MIDAPSPNWSSRRGAVPSMVIIHGDAGTTDLGTVSWIQSATSQVSYHYLVGREGAVWQFVSEHNKAWHAGRSSWAGRENLNTVSIGVAFANNGTQPYEPIQYKVGGRLVARICKRHSIPCDMIRAHYEVSPGRKTDPWAHFDWAKFYEWFGLYSGDKV